MVDLLEGFLGIQLDKEHYQLVVEATHLRNMLVKFDNFPKDRDEN